MLFSRQGFKLSFLACCSLILVVLANSIVSLNGGMAIARSSLPIATYEGAPILDPTQWTLEELPPFVQAGNLQVSQEIVSLLGFDPSLSWQVGDRPMDVLKLGSFRDAFGLESFDLQTISTLSGKPLEGLSLQNLELMSWQSISTLVSAIPSLGRLPVSQVAPIADLVRQTATRPTALLIGDLLQANPDLAQLHFGERIHLGQYALSSIPGLTTTSISAFSRAGNSSISGVPGLAQVKANQFPIPLTIHPAAVVARVDLPLHTREGQRSNAQPISGSDRAGFNVPCQQSCSHLETEQGLQWFAGDQQQVPGGEGVLGQVFGGQEPTGRLPYGSVFKVVVANVNEAAGTIDTQLFFRFCHRGVVDLGCTPYGIGPLPFLSYQESHLMFLGVLQSGTSSAQASTPLPASQITVIKPPGGNSGYDPLSRQTVDYSPAPIHPTFGFVQL